MQKFLKQNEIRKGRVAQLVQSTWFTPKGSGVRIPSRPQKEKASILEAFFDWHILFIVSGD